MKYLGIDYGKKRVGLAVSDEGGKLAFPHSVLTNNARSINSGQAKLLESVIEIVKKEGVEAIVMGESKNFQNEKNEIMKEIEEFKKELENKIKIIRENFQIYLEPEFLTSIQAKQITGENEMHDASAAAIILQSYLDKN